MIGVVLAVLLVAVGTCGVFLYRSAMSVKNSASVIMAQASTLKDSLKNGDESGLTTSLNAIVSNVNDINAEVSSPLWTAATLIPVIGEDVRSVQTLGTVASDLVNDALVPVATSLSGTGLSSLLQDGSVNVELIRTVSSSVSDAIPVIQSSVDTISSLPEAHIPQLRDVLEQVQGPVSEAQGLVGQIEPILNLLPQMLGADGQTRTYLVIAQNNSELRATGGLPGSWGTISITDGVISMGEFQSILHDEGLQVEITDEERAAIATNMDTDPAQVNCTADFTRVGQLARDYWAQEGLGTVDGVVAIDPVFLQRLLSLTGGFTAPDGTAVDGTNAAKVLLSDTYWMFGNDGDAQDAYFAAVAGLAFETIMDNLGNAGMTDLMGVVEQSGKDGRLLVWMANEDEQSLMVNMGLSGRLESDPTKPVLGVYLNDDTYSKISWYASSSTVVGEGVKNADGTTTYDVTTTLTNTITPEEADNAPTYISGTNGAKRDVSDMLDFVFFYAPAGGTITDFQVSEGALFEDYGIADETLSGLQVLRMRTHLLAGETATFTYKVTVSADAAEPLSVRTTPLAQESLMGQQGA
ncbi:DUF4012 domain-containing protein [Olsenella sp. An188]|uniref:DUF4012 domain-containing protein n=1 Tax=Olsenella sp. An188 TaxID=1965579 RepID=UPI0013020F5F|nr:DUF4012 domain-containing protein [Olsenella sp. An188]